MRFINKKIAFTLTEVLLAVAVVGIIAALVLPALVTKFEDDLLTQATIRTTQSIQGVLDQLDITENKAFHNTMMYVESEPASYADNSGLFLKKYMRISKYCGDSNGDCFAKKYYQYENITRKEYVPTYKGACASLKDGSSICLTPQVAGNRIDALIDINGPKGPNILARDLRQISFEPKSKITYDNISDGKVYHSDVAPLTPEEDPCTVAPYGLACCRLNSSKINYESPCCVHAEFKNQEKCKNPKEDPCFENPYGFECCDSKNPESFLNENAKCCENFRIADDYPEYCYRDVKVELVCKQQGTIITDSNCVDEILGQDAGNSYIEDLIVSSTDCKVGWWRCILKTTDEDRKSVV